jgi:hypothetical protein
MGRRIKAAVFEATRLNVSVGISGNKYVAKVASAHGKPNGLLVVPPDRAVQWLAPMPVDRLWGGREDDANQARLMTTAHRARGERELRLRWAPAALLPPGRAGPATGQSGSHGEKHRIRSHAERGYLAPHGHRAAPAPCVGANRAPAACQGVRAGSASG